MAMIASQSMFVSAARLPHAWLQDSLPTAAHHVRPVNLNYVNELVTQQVKARRYRTLDLYDLGA